MTLEQRITALAQAIGADVKTLYESGGGGAGGAAVYTDTVPPSSPSADDLWFNSGTGELSIYYDDGNSAQWLVVSGPQGPPGVDAYSNLDGGNPTTNYGGLEALDAGGV